MYNRNYATMLLGSVAIKIFGAFKFHSNSEAKLYGACLGIPLLGALVN